MATKYKILYNESQVMAVMDNDNAVTYSDDMVLVDTLQHAWVNLLSMGVNCRRIEDLLIVDQQSLAGMHDQVITALPTDATISRQVDLAVMHVLPVIKAFKLVWKVKYYRDDLYLGFEEMPDSIRVLTADNTTRIVIDANGNTMGEYDYFLMLMRSGANMFDLFYQHVLLRDSEGRFN